MGLTNSMIQGIRWNERTRYLLRRRSRFRPCPHCNCPRLDSVRPRTILHEACVNLRTCVYYGFLSPRHFGSCQLPHFGARHLASLSSSLDTDRPGTGLRPMRRAKLDGTHGLRRYVNPSVCREHSVLTREAIAGSTCVTQNACEYCRIEDGRSSAVADEGFHSLLPVYPLLNAHWVLGEQIKHELGGMGLLGQSGFTRTLDRRTDNERNATDSRVYPENVTSSSTLLPRPVKLSPRFQLHVLKNCAQDAPQKSGVVRRLARLYSWSDPASLAVRRRR